MRVPRGTGRRRTRASSGAGPRSRRPTGPGRGREGARAAADGRRVVPAARARRAGRSCSGSAPRADRERGRGGRGADRRRARGGAAGLPRRCARPARPRPASRAGSAWRRSGRSPERRPPSAVACSVTLGSCRARQGLRVREPEGRRRQDDDRDQPRRLPRRGGRARARRRPRPAGERHLGARHARERHLDATTCSTARRSPSSRSRRAFANLFLVPSKPELAGAAVELVAARRTASATSPRRSQHADGFDFVLLDCPPSLGAADRERARRRRPRDRAGAGRVLRARGARAADAVDQPDQGAAEPEARDRRRAAHDGRRAHAALRRRRGARCASTSATSSSSTVVPRSVRVAEAPSHGLPVTHYDRRSRGAEAYWKVAMELVERPADAPARRGLGRGFEVLIGGADARARARPGRADPRRTRGSRASASTARPSAGSPSRSRRRG